MGDVAGKFLEPLEAIFTLPETSDLKGFIAAYEVVLESFSDEVLTLAARRIVAERESRVFPLPAECKRACRAAAAVLNPKPTARPRPWD